MADTTMTTDRSAAEKTALAVLVSISFCHLLNDMLQSLLPAIYPMIKDRFSLTFSEVGLITLTYQITASLLQPLVGLYTDRSPKNYALPVGMGFTLTGLLLLSVAPSFPLLLLAAALVGTGSSVFHPESSRVARLASGGRHGLAQSLFQVGGNVGSAIGPLAAAFLILPRGQSSVAWFSLGALLAIIVLTRIGTWFGAHRKAKASSAHRAVQSVTLSRREIGRAVAVLMALIFSKYFYLASLTSYYTFYLISRFGVSVKTAQIDLFVFLGATAVGTIAGGPIGDRIGRKKVIWGSILGVLPFTLVLPYASLSWTVFLTIPIGLILASAFSAIVVYAQELMPGRVGMVAGLFFGFAFGMGGVGAAVLGVLADWQGITTVYRLCAFLPLIGLLTAFLPNIEVARSAKAAR
jgi:FSR family fosmidomycin resistance protein-like MFS transporter